MLKRIFNLSQNSCFYHDSLQLPFIKQSITTPSLFAFNSGNGTECLCGCWKWKFIVTCQELFFFWIHWFKNQYFDYNGKLSPKIDWFPSQLELIDWIYQGSYANLQWFIMKFFTSSVCGVAPITKLFMFYFDILYESFTKSIGTVSYCTVKASRSSHAGNVAFYVWKHEEERAPLTHIF